MCCRTDRLGAARVSTALLALLSLASGCAAPRPASGPATVRFKSVQPDTEIVVDYVEDGVERSQRCKAACELTMPSGPVTVRATSNRRRASKRIELGGGTQYVEVDPRNPVLLGIGWSTLAVGASLIAIGFSEAGPDDRSEPVGTGSHNESVPSWAWFLLPGTVMVVGGGVLIDFGTGSVDLVPPGR